MEPINKTRKGLILLVDDKEEFRGIYGDRLRFAKYDVLEAKDGKEALKILSKKKPDLIMSDLNMPHMDGYQLISEIKASDDLKDIPIIVMSVFDQSEHLKRALELGALDYFIKGRMTPNDIVVKVDSLFSIKNIG